MERRGFLRSLGAIVLTPLAWWPWRKKSVFRDMTAEDATDIVTISDSAETELWMRQFDAQIMRNISAENHRIRVESRLNRIKAKQRLREKGWDHPLP